MATNAEQSRSAAARARAGKILRLGVIQGGKIIEEKLLRKRQAITIGTNPKNSIAIPVSNLPKTQTLFEVKSGKYLLAFSERMDGRVSVQNGVLDFASLKAQSLVKKKGNTYILPLNEDSRGKVIIGDVTVLFQFVVPPPMPEKPKLPANARGSLANTVDWFYAALLIGSAIFHIAFIVIFYNTPIPEPITLEEMDDRWAQLIVPDMKKEDRKPPEKKEGEGEGEKKKEQKAKPQEEKQEKKGMSEEQKAAARAARKEKARKLVSNKGVLAILGTAGSGSAGGVVADVFGEGGIGVNAGAFDGITGVGVAGSDGQRTRRGASDVGNAASIGGLATSGGGNVATGKKRELKVGIVKSARPEVDGDLDPGAISRYVKKRIRSIRDCYERELKRNPNLAGKIAISFTIETTGRVSETFVDENTMNSSSVANCIMGRIKRWIFPRPKGGSVTVAYPFIFSPAG